MDCSPVMLGEDVKPLSRDKVLNTRVCLYVDASPAMLVGRPGVNWTTPYIHVTALDVVWR